jgi:hypothetical protein
MTSLVYIATLTTGSDEQEHEVIELALLDEDGRTLLHTSFDPRANYEDLLYSTADLAPSPRFHMKAIQILGHLTGPVVAGHNTHFHMRFLKRMLRDAIEDERIDRLPDVYVDVASLIWEQLGLPGMGLEEACALLRIDYKPNHSALEDAKAAHAVYETVSQASWWQRWWWQWRSS